MPHTVKRFFNTLLGDFSVRTVEIASYDGTPSQAGYITFETQNNKTPDTLTLIKKLAATRNTLFPRQEKHLAFSYGFFNPETSILAIRFFYSGTVSNGDKQQIIGTLSSIIHTAALAQKSYGKPSLPWQINAFGHALSA